MPRRTHRPNPDNTTPEDLITALKCAQTGRTVVRLQTINWLLTEDISLAQVARLAGVTERTVRNWVRRFNTKGIDGLLEKPHTRCKRAFSAQRAEQIKQLLDQPQLVNQVHWTGKKLYGYLKHEWCERFSYGTLMRFFKYAGYRLLRPRR